MENGCQATLVLGFLCNKLNFLKALIKIFQYFEFVEEMEWAIEVCKESGKPVASTMCIGPLGDVDGVAADECAVRMAKAGSNVGKDSRLSDQ